MTVANSALPASKAKITVEVPLYTLWDASRYLRIPFWGICVLDGRFRGWPHPEEFFHYCYRGLPFLPVVDGVLPLTRLPEEDTRIPFDRFANFFVRAAALQTLTQWARDEDRSRERWERLSRGVWKGLEESRQASDSFEGESAEERLERLAEPYSQLLEEGDAATVRKWLNLRLERIVLEGNSPVRLFPFSRDPAENSPRTVVMDPRIRFGRPAVAGHGTPTDSIFERHQAGDSVAELAADYSLTSEEVEEAIRYESFPASPIIPFLGW